MKRTDLRPNRGRRGSQPLLRREPDLSPPEMLFAMSFWGAKVPGPAPCGLTTLAAYQMLYNSLLSLTPLLFAGGLLYSTFQFQILISRPRSSTWGIVCPVRSSRSMRTNMNDPITISIGYHYYALYDNQWCCPAKTVAYMTIRPCPTDLSRNLLIQNLGDALVAVDDDLCLLERFPDWFGGLEDLCEFLKLDVVRNISRCATRQGLWFL